MRGDMDAPDRPRRRPVRALPYVRYVAQTSAIELMKVGFTVLPTAEQDQLLVELERIRGERITAADTEAGRCLRSLQRVAEHLGEPPNSQTYRKAWRELKDAGDGVVSLRTVIKHYGSWRRARESLEKATGGMAASRIEQQIAVRRLDKIWRYTEQTLRQAMADCVAAIGHVPQVAEFEHWRRGALELRRAAGEDATHIPSPTPYRRRYGTWEAALLRFGYTPDQVAERLERP